MYNFLGRYLIYCGERNMNYKIPYTYFQILSTDNRFREIPLKMVYIQYFPAQVIYLFLKSSNYL